MPTLYVYLGIQILFYSNEHTPIHVHGQYDGCERRAEIFVLEGKIVNIVFKHVKGKKHLPTAQQADFENFVHAKSNEIVEKWIEFFVLNKRLSPRTITRRIR